MSTEKYAFSSVPWVDYARSYVLNAAVGQDLSGVSMSFAEVFTDAPAALQPDASGRVGWYIRIVDGEIEVSSGVLEQADLRIMADYESTLPLARAVFAGDEVAQAEAMRTVEAMIADGRMVRSGDENALAGLPWLADLHDTLAKRTL